MTKIGLRVESSIQRYALLTMWINGRMVSDPSTMRIHFADLTGFLLRMQADTVTVDRERCSQELIHKVEGIDGVRII